MVLMSRVKAGVGIELPATRVSSLAVSTYAMIADVCFCLIALLSPWPMSQLSMLTTVEDVAALTFTLVQVGD
jgi:hypothetical protein